MTDANERSAGLARELGITEVALCDLRSALRQRLELPVTAKESEILETLDQRLLTSMHTEREAADATQLRDRVRKMERDNADALAERDLLREGRQQDAGIIHSMRALVDAAKSDLAEARAERDRLRALGDEAACRRQGDREVHAQPVGRSAAGHSRPRYRLGMADAFAGVPMIDDRQKRALEKFVRVAKAIRGLQFVYRGQSFTLDTIDFADEARAFDEALDDLTLAGLPS